VHYLINKIPFILLIALLGLAQSLYANDGTILKVKNNIKIAAGSYIVLHGSLNTTANIAGLGTIVIDVSPNHATYSLNQLVILNTHNHKIQNLKIRNCIVSLRGSLNIEVLLEICYGSSLILNQYNVYVNNVTEIKLARNVNIIQNDIGSLINIDAVIMPILPPLAPQYFVYTTTKILHSSNKKAQIYNTGLITKQQVSISKIYNSILLDIPFPPPKTNI